MEPTLSTNEAAEVAATRPMPRVTEASIKDKIVNAEYIVKGHLTICILTMSNGWLSTGVSAPAHAANFDPEVGKRYAFDNAFKPLWQLEGYLLRQRLFEESLL